MSEEESRLINREALLAELQKAFDTQAAEVLLLGVLDKVVVQVRQAEVTREDFRDLKQIVVALAEAQQRTEERIRELAEAQRRTEERVEELAKAQTRTEERLDRLEAAVERLVEAQRRTEEQIAELAEVQARTEREIERLNRQIGGLSETVGGGIEDIAYIVLHDVLRREFGWEVGVLERSWQTWDDEPEEVNVFGTATDPARPERAIWIVGEAKHNLTAEKSNGS